MKCEKCGRYTTKLKFYKEKSGWCPTCFYADEAPKGQSAMITTDEIPGGLEIKHGICNDDGTPRKYYSKSEIKRVASEAGWTVYGDTPVINNRVADQRAREAEARRNKEKSR